MGGTGQSCRMGVEGDSWGSQSGQSVAQSAGGLGAGIKDTRTLVVPAMVGVWVGWWSVHFGVGCAFWFCVREEGSISQGRGFQALDRFNRLRLGSGPEARRPAPIEIPGPGALRACLIRGSTPAGGSGVRGSQRRQEKAPACKSGGDRARAEENTKDAKHKRRAMWSREERAEENDWKDAGAMRGN